MLPLLVSLLIAATSSNPSSLRSEQKQASLEYKNKIQETQQERETYREEFKNKLSEIADERKKTIAQDLEEKIQTTNTKWVEKYGEALDRLEQILSKVEEKSGETPAVLEAKDKLNAAKETVNAQAEKTYKIEFDSEDNLGQSIRKTISLLHEDLKLVKQSVQAAKKAVVAAIAEWNNSQQSPTPVSSPTISPSPTPEST